MFDKLKGSYNKSKAIRKISVMYTDPTSSKKANYLLLNLMHNTPSLQTVMATHSATDEIILDIQEFIFFMGGYSLIFVKGHNMLVSPFAFPQTLDFLLRHYCLLRESVTMNYEIYQKVYDWFKYNSSNTIDDLVATRVSPVVNDNVGEKDISSKNEEPSSDDIDVKQELPKVEEATTSDIKNAYLETCKSRNNNTQFRELVRLNFTGSNVDSIVKEMAVVSISLSPNVMTLTEPIISKWVDLGRKKGFWNLNGSRLFDLFDKDTRATFDREKVEYNDNDIEYLFQYLLLVFTGSALNDIENQRFMGIE